MNVSVCMATYNGEKYIREQLDSILNQLSEDDEVIISDDSSTDKTINIIKSYNDKRIKIYAENRFRSPIFNFENALKNSKNDLIFLCDQDDIWEDNKVKIMKEKLENYDMVVSDCRVVNEKLLVMEESFFQLRNSGRGFIKNLNKNTYLGCCMAFNRKILERSLPFPKDIPMHDIWLGMIGELFGKSLFINDKLLKYRRHGGNASSASEKSPNSLYKKIKMRLILLVLLIAREIRWRKK